jgi:hypothetical protein
MASTYSNLKIQLMGTGENSGTWGNITNANLGTALEEAITGSANVTFASGTVTLTLTDSNSTQTARNLRLNLTGTSGGAQDLIVPAIEKVYIVNNGCADTITVKNSGGTGIAVPAGKTMWVYNNGTNVLDAVTHLTSLTLASALPIASGGTGTNTTTFCNLQSNVSGVLPVTNGGTGVNASTGTGSVVLSASPTFTGVPLSTTAANGTNTTQIATTAFVNNSVTIATASLGTMSTQNANAVAITGGTITGGTITGITDLAVADGGTGVSTLAANNVLLGNGTSAIQTVAPSTSGNVLTSNGTTWTSSALSSLSAFDKSLSTNGYQKLPGGLIMQWGEILVPADGTATVTWPIAFPTACLQATCCQGYAFAINADAGAGIYDLSTTTATIRNGSNTGGSSSTMRWMAFGH